MAWERQRKTEREEDVDAELTLLDSSHAHDWAIAGWIHIPSIVSPFPPFSLLFVTRVIYVLVCLSLSISSLQSALCLFFAPGTVHCCLTSALITAPGRPLSTSRLACESTRPRAVITLKSSKSGHVKLGEVFREPTQVSEGVK